MRIRQAVMAWGLAIACAVSIVPAHAAHLADGTAVHVRLTTDLLSSHAVVGARVDMEIAQPVTLDGGVVIPVGSTAWGAVQMAKPGKALHFDIEGLRLPNKEIVKLRCLPQKTTRMTKDEIKVEMQVAGDLGAAKGTEFAAYLDQDINFDVPVAPGAPAPAAPEVAPGPGAPEVAPSAPAAPEVAPGPPAPEVAPPAPAAPEVAPAAVPGPAAPAPAVAPEPAAVEPPTAKEETPSAPPAPVVSAPVAPPAPAPVEHPAPAAPVAPPAPAAPVVPPAPAAQPGEYITVECFSEPDGADILIDDEFHGSTPSILKLAPGNHQIEYRLMGYKPHTQPLNLTAGTGLRDVRITLEKQP